MKRMQLSSLFAAALFVAGCSSPPYAARMIDGDVEMTAAVVVTDSSLHSVVRVGASLLERIPGTNQLRVTVPVRNVGDDVIQIRAQTTFLDAQRMPIGDETPRAPYIIPPGQTIYVVVLSQKDGADQFTMRLSWNR